MTFGTPFLFNGWYISTLKEKVLTKQILSKYLYLCCRTFLSHFSRLEYWVIKGTVIFIKFSIFFSWSVSPKNGTKTKSSDCNYIERTVNRKDNPYMMTSSNGNIFRVTGHLCGDFAGHRWIPRTKASDAELWCFLWSAPEWTVEKTIVRLMIWDAIALIMTSDINRSEWLQVSAGYWHQDPCKTPKTPSGCIPRCQVAIIPVLGGNTRHWISHAWNNTIFELHYKTKHNLALFYQYSGFWWNFSQMANIMKMPVHLVTKYNSLGKRKNDIR